MWDFVVYKGFYCFFTGNLLYRGSLCGSFVSQGFVLPGFRNIYRGSLRQEMGYTGLVIPGIQPRSQSSSAISDVTSPVKLVGKIRIARTGLGTRLPGISCYVKAHSLYRNFDILVSLMTAIYRGTLYLRISQQILPRTK